MHSLLSIKACLYLFIFSGIMISLLNILSACQLYTIPSQLSCQLSNKIIRLKTSLLNKIIKNKKTATKPSFLLLFTMNNNVFIGKEDGIEYGWLNEKENDVTFLLLPLPCELWVVHSSETHWGALAPCSFSVTAASLSRPSW